MRDPEMRDPEMRDPAPSRPTRASNPWLFALVALLVAAFLASLLFRNDIAPALMAATAHLRAMGLAGWLIFTLAQAAIALLGILPASLLGIAAGAAFGIPSGFVSSGFGLLVGASIAFSLSRSKIRPLVSHMLNRGGRAASFDRLVTGGGWRSVALLRVSPVMPFSLTSYALGLSSVTPRSYVVGTLASLPALLGYVAIGALGGSGVTAYSRGDALIHVAILLIGAGATLALTLAVSRQIARGLAARPIPK